MYWSYIIHEISQTELNFVHDTYINKQNPQNPQKPHFASFQYLPPTVTNILTRGCLDIFWCVFFNAINVNSAHLFLLPEDFSKSMASKESSDVQNLKWTFLFKGPIFLMFKGKSQACCNVFPLCISFV